MDKLYFPLNMDARLKCPFVMQVVGPSLSGKTRFVGRLLRLCPTLFDRPVDHVIWFSPHGHLPRELTDHGPLPFTIDVRTALSDEADIEEVLQETDDIKHRVVVIDDFGAEVKNSSAVTSLYTKGSHHRGISVIQVLQTLFLQSKEARTRSLNTHYLVLMRQTRDVSQVKTLSQQIVSTARGREAFMEAYRDAVQQRPYAYLLISFHPKSPPPLLLRTNIFPDEAPQVVYSIPQKVYKNW